MALSKLDYVKEFIDYLHFEYSKYVYENERKYGRTPLEIYNCYSWKDKESYLTLTDNEESYIDDEWLSCTIDDFLDSNCFPKCEDIRHGVEQTAFIFDDIVYKISSNEVGAIIDNLKEDIDDQYHSLFCSYTWLEDYRGCHIYIQEKVTSYYYSNKYTPYSSLSAEQKKTINNMDYYVNISDDCIAAIVLEEGTDFLIGLCSDLEYAGYRYDIHDSNWGFNDAGLVRIFDPIYEKEYY